MLEWLRSCYGNPANDVYKGKLTFSIADKSVTVDINDKLHFTYAYDHMVIAQQEHPDLAMTIQFEGKFKNESATISYSSFEDFHAAIKPLLDHSHSRLRYK